MKREEKITKKVYTEYVRKEWKRLIKDEFHKLEFNTTLFLLKKYLPRKGLILDAGGGPGRYTIELAKKGHDIVLLDLTPANLEFAKKQIKKAKVQKRVKEIIEGSIVKLPFKDNSFNAVLCLGGPLSHVKGEKNRRKVVSELIRVAKKGAPIFVSVMGKYAVLMQSLARWPNEVAMTKHFKDYATFGEDYMWVKNGYCHFFTREELRKLFERKNVKLLDMAGLEGLASPVQENIKNIDRRNPKAWKNWLWFHNKSYNDPFVIDASQHMMVIVKKR